LIAMKALSHLLHCDGRTDRLTYQRNVAALIAAKLIADSITLAVAVPQPDIGLIAYGWLNPFTLIEPWLTGDLSSAICASTFLFFTALVWNSVHRARDAGWNHWIGLLTAVPFANVPATFLLSFAPRRKHTVWDLV